MEKLPSFLILIEIIIFLTRERLKINPENIASYTENLTRQLKFLKPEKLRNGNLLQQKNMKDSNLDFLINHRALYSSLGILDSKPSPLYAPKM
jgi:hypothetical protein